MEWENLSDWNPVVSGWFATVSHVKGINKDIKNDYEL